MKKILVVTHVNPDCQAQAIGIQPGDIVFSYDGTPISTNKELSNAILKVKPEGKYQVLLTIIRNNKKIKYNVTTDSLGIISEERELPVEIAINNEIDDSKISESLNKEITTIQKQIVVKTYTGSQTQTAQLFQTDSELMAAEGYFPISQSWAPGSYGCGTFLVALALCVLIVGILVFIYMLVVPPDGTLSVTYELRTASDSQQDVTPIDEKTCPMCAEQVKAAARICRFCGHNFVPDSV